MSKRPMALSLTLSLAVALFIARRTRARVLSPRLESYERPWCVAWQKREEYGNTGQGTVALDASGRTMWIFEPHVADRCIEAARGAGIPVDRNAWLDRAQRRKEEGDRASRDRHARAGSLRSEDVHRRHLRRRPDGRGGCRLPRRPRGERDVRRDAQRRAAGRCVTPSLRGDASRSVRRARRSEASGVAAADQRRRRRREPARRRAIQAYCFRMCLTDVRENRRPSPQARRLRPRKYELLLRNFDAGLRADVRQVRSGAQPQDRHEQQRAVLDRLHRRELRLSRRRLRHARARSSASTCRISRACCGSSRTTRACRRKCATRVQPVGPGEGRVRRQRQLAAPALRARGAADGRATS